VDVKDGEREPAQVSGEPHKGSEAAGEPAREAAAPASAQAEARAARRDEAAEQALLARLAKRDRRLVFLTTILAVGGLASMVVFGLVLYQMHAGLRLNREAFDLARESTQRQLRAYMGMQDFKCGGCGDNAGPDEVVLRAGNDGQTPALNVYGRIGWNVGDVRCGASGSGFSYSYVQARYFRTFRTFAKDARDATTFDPNREAIAQARTSGTRLCIYGTVNYTTIFTDLGERETRFCFWYTRGSERTLCEEHNDLN
jgi:hypothetical protein